MQVYLYMGTHLAELRCCIEALVNETPHPDATVEIFTPRGIEWQSPKAHCTVTVYDPDTVLWVFDPDKEGTCHILVDPRAPLIFQLESLAEHLSNCLIEPTKILTCVDCAQAESSGKLRSWLDACIFYSDIVLLGNRANAPKTFVREFQKQYERLCYPCMFMYLKGNGVPADIGEVLIPGTRRMSHMFEMDTANDATEAMGIVIESSCDLDLNESENDPFRSPSDEQPARHVPDPSEFVVWPT